MKICNDCGAVFADDEAEFVRDSLGLPASLVCGRAPDEHEICPSCRSEEIEEAITCCMCGKNDKLTASDYIGKDVSNGTDDYVCKKCGDEIMHRYTAEFDENERALIIERQV